MGLSLKETLSKIRKATQEMALGYFFPHEAATQLNYLLDLELQVLGKMNSKTFKSHILSLKIPSV